ncbi:MAG: DUF4401 domain-containing protein [Betaproteobacteria bacterium]|nr:MAG: DUF4401 domain-containing protein [Betaproteobacteria bacterium]
MNALRRQDLWQRLREAALVEGDMPEPDAASAPWYVRAMLGAAGWIGALFLLGFVGAGFVWVMESASASFVVGALTCAGATAIFRLRAEGDFAAQFGMAVSLAGQAMMVFGLAQWFERSLTGMALAVALQQGLLFVLVPNFIHRCWTSWTAASAAALALAGAGLPGFVPAALTAALVWIWLSEFDQAERGALLRAGGYGMALAAVQSTMLHGELWALWILGRGTHGALGGETALWLGRLASGAVLVWAVLRLLRREGVPLQDSRARVALGGAALLALISLRAPGVGPAVAILVIGHANGNRVLAGLGILSLLGYLANYYYSLQATLLVKSALLASAGIALLAARLAMRRWWPEAPEVQRA